MIQRFVLAALAPELRRVMEAADARPEADFNGCRVYVGSFGGGLLGCGVIGMGIAQAAWSMGVLFSKYPVREAVLIGSAGAFPGAGCRVGDLVVADSETFSEWGVCIEKGIGDTDALHVKGVNATLLFDRGLKEDLFKAAQSVANARLGPLLTVAGVTSEASLAQRRRGRFDALAENMEGYALALASRRLGIRAAEIRGISNMAGVRDLSRWNLDLAQRRCQEALLEYLKEAPCFD